MTNGLTPIQMANWQMLLMLATAAKADLIGACCSYRMERCLAERILEMTPLELMMMSLALYNDLARLMGAH